MKYNYLCNMKWYRVLGSLLIILMFSVGISGCSDSEPVIGEHILLDTKIISPSYVGNMSEIDYKYTTNPSYELDFLRGINVITCASISEADQEVSDDEASKIDTSYSIPVYLTTKDGYHSGQSTGTYIAKAKGFSYIMANRPITDDSYRDYYITQTAVYLFQDYLHELSGDSHDPNINNKTCKAINNKRKSLFGGDEKQICEEIMTLYEGAIEYQTSELSSYYPVCYISLSELKVNAIVPLFVDDLGGEFVYDPLSTVVHEPSLEDPDLQLGVLASEVVYFEDCSDEYRDSAAAEDYIAEMINTNANNTAGFIVVGFESDYESNISSDHELSFKRACAIAEDMVEQGVSPDKIYICRLNEKFRMGYHYVDCDVDGNFDMDIVRMNMYGYIYPIQDTWMAEKLLSMPYVKYSDILNN